MCHPSPSYYSLATTRSFASLPSNRPVHAVSQWQQMCERGQGEGDPALGRQEEQEEDPLAAVRRSKELRAAISSVQKRFGVGDYYVWLYRDVSGAYTSWERYSVSDSNTQDNFITIEMATKFSVDQEYFTHHRMTIDLAAHLFASNKEACRIGFEYLDDNRVWTPSGQGDNVQAFEEKFDIFRMLGDYDAFIPASGNDCHVLQVRDASVNGRKIGLTRSARHAYTLSWYGPSEHSLAGVAMRKDFADKIHSFQLIAKGSSGAPEKLFDIRM
jgi:hypothetical protein